MEKDFRKLDLEELDLDDYFVLRAALNNCDFYCLDIYEEYYNELLSKLDRNIDKLEYNSRFD